MNPRLFLSPEPSGGAAPAAPASAPASTPAPTSTPSATSTPSPSGGTPAPGQKSGASDFDPDKWDGSEDSLPDNYRKFYSKASSTWTQKEREYKAQVENLIREAQSNEELYNMLLSDPTVDDSVRKQLTETRAKLGEFEKKYSETESSLQKAQKELEAAQKKLQKIEESGTATQRELEELRAAEERHNIAWLENFKSTHKDIYADPNMRGRLATLIEADFDPDLAAQMVKLPDEIIYSTADYRNKGIPEDQALRLALLDMQVKNGWVDGNLQPKAAPAPRSTPRQSAQAGPTSADLTAGAKPTSIPSVTDAPTAPASSVMDLRAARERAAALAFSRKSR